MITELPLCKFLGCEQPALQMHDGKYWPSCNYHNKGGIFGSGESYEQYQIIEQDFIDFIKVVPLVPEHFKVYSPILRDIIIRVCVQIEIFFKEWSKQECSYKNDFPLLLKYNEKYKKGKYKDQLKGEKNWTMADYFIFRKEFDEWSSIHVLPLNENIFPFEDWTKPEVPFWWNVYNGIKHNGYVSKKQADLKTALYALASLFLMHTKNYYSYSYLQGFNFSYVNYSINRVIVKTNDLTTPLDSKKYLFKANRSFSREVELVTQEQFRNHGRNDFY